MTTREIGSIDERDDERLGLLVEIIEILGERVIRGGIGKMASPGTEGERLRSAHAARPAIYITGRTEKRASNIVLVNGMRVVIGDVPFTLFLRLAVELFRNRKGTVPKSMLISRGYIKADGEFQAIARLRQAFNTALGGLGPEHLIESCEHRSLRLSVDPSTVGYNKGELLLHRNERIRRLAERLP